MPTDPQPSVLQAPLAVAAWLALVPAGVLWLEGREGLRRLFGFAPAILWVYFLPTVATTLGLTPAASPVYGWLIRYLLPFALVLLMVAVDLPAVARLGGITVLMMLAGTVGIVVGGPLSLLLFGSVLPPDAWKGFAALAGSWIGGPTTMVAMTASVGTPPSALGPVIVVDAVVGYGWMALLLLLSAYQGAFDRRIGARTDALDRAGSQMLAARERRRPLEAGDAVQMVGLGVVVAAGTILAGDRLPELGDPVVVGHTTWTVLLVVTAALLLSFTPASRLEEAGASSLGYAALYVLVASLGAQADLRAIVHAPLYLAAGALWITVHAAVLLVAARLARAPLVFFATGSMANVGGVVSAPIVAETYRPALAPVGLLLGVLGNVVGIYGALLCAWIMGLLAR